MSRINRIQRLGRLWLDGILGCLAICGQESTNMAPVSVSRGRGLLLFFSVIVIVLLILRGFPNISFGDGLVFGSGKSLEIKMLTYNIWLSDEKMQERIEWKL